MKLRAAKTGDKWAGWGLRYYAAMRENRAGTGFMAFSWTRRDTKAPACLRDRDDRPPARRRPVRLAAQSRSGRARRASWTPPLAERSGRRTAATAGNRAPADRP